MPVSVAPCGVDVDVRHQQRQDGDNSIQGSGDYSNKPLQSNSDHWQIPRLMHLQQSGTVPSTSEHPATRRSAARLAGSTEMGRRTFIGNSHHKPMR
mmetsp:Transcript_81152/g.205119  ORF Transcript_81152/g.205119 Transcript_81152/m.205119 type:complete len:96 (-) Transcript_81152:91-378(-)